MNIIQTIENDVVAVWHIVEADAVKFGAVLWQDAQPILKQVESAVYADLRTVIQGMLVAFQGRDLADIETALLMVLENGKTTLFAEAQSLGSDLLQAIIAHVRGT